MQVYTFKNNYHNKKVTFGCVWMTAGSSSLTWPSLMRLWGRVRLHTSCTWNNQGTHTDKLFSLMATWDTQPFVMINKL